MLDSKHPFIRISQELAEICQPLELIGINHFTYQKSFNDGSRINLSSKPQWIEDYYNLKLYESSLFEAKSTLYKPYHEIWIGDYDLEVYRCGKLRYNNSHSITITEPQSNSCEFYLFSATEDNLQVIEFLSRNVDILYHFILYFKDRAGYLLKNAHKYKLSLNTIRVPYHDLLLAREGFNNSMLERKKEFLRETQIYRYIFGEKEHPKAKLSKREIDCVLHLLDNKTAEETAALMDISRRTVESYLENIKIKLNCTNKVELYRKLKKYHFHSLEPS